MTKPDEPHTRGAETLDEVPDHIKKKYGLEDKPRRWTFEDEPRLDKDGTEWYACDPYPTWFRWTKDRRLITTDERSIFHDDFDGKATAFPGWAKTSDPASV